MNIVFMPIALALALTISCSSGGEPKPSISFDETPISENSSTMTIKSDLSQWSAATGSMVLMCKCANLTVDRGFKYFYIDEQSRGTQADERPSFRLTFYKSPPQGMPVIDPLTAARYEGDWPDENGRSHGSIVWLNGDRYEGDWRDGKQHGYGTGIWSNGAQYEGDWRDGNRDGHGTMVWPSGVSYEGDWVNGSVTGHGTFITENGDRHEGDFIDGNGSTSRGVYITKSSLGGLAHIFPLGVALSYEQYKEIAEKIGADYMDAAFDAKAEGYLDICKEVKGRVYKQSKVFIDLSPR